MNKKKNNAKIINRDGRFYMIIHALEPMEDENGHTYFQEYDREEDITGREDREFDFCKICEFGKYPNCMERCQRIK